MIQCTGQLAKRFWARVMIKVTVEVRDNEGMNESSAACQAF